MRFLYCTESLYQSTTSCTYSARGFGLYFFTTKTPSIGQSTSKQVAASGASKLIEEQPGLPARLSLKMRTSVLKSPPATKKLASELPRNCSSIFWNTPVARTALPCEGTPSFTCCFVSTSPGTWQETLHMLPCLAAA